MIIYDSSNRPIIGLDVDDASYAYREIMGDCKVYLEFALTQHVELEIGSYVTFQGDRYELMSVADVTIQHNRDYEYKVTFEGPQARFSKYRVHNPVDGRLVFEMTATPAEHLAMIVANLVEREGANSWSAGVCIDGAQKTLSYNHTKLNDALTQLANAYDTEWEVVNGSINLNKVEYNTESPLALGYGRNTGFKPGVGRTNYGETGQIERVYIQGGDRNISLKEYGNSTLLLPKGFSFKFDGEHFRYFYNGTSMMQEAGFDLDKAVDMITDENGFSVMLATAGTACNEESLDLTDIYPKRVGTVYGVYYLYDHQYLTWAEINELGLTEEQWLSVQVDIVDTGIPAALDYADCLLANDEPLTVIFQDGMLAGREFQATFRKEARMVMETDPETGIESEVAQRPANRFELVRANFNGIEMPNATFRPNAATGGTLDKYIVVNCYLPTEYIRDYATASGAEFEALRQAAKFLYANKDVQLTFKGEVDDLYSKRNWTTVGGKLKVGGCVSFTHPQVQSTALVTRIVALKQYINNPYSPEVTLSNESVKGGLSSRLAQMSGDKAHVLNQQYALERYARRSFRDAKETMDALENALLEGFTERISPIAVQTMQLLLGDESLQFRYVNSKTNPSQVSPGISYNATTRKLICNVGIIQHMTLGIDSLKSSHAASEYKFWDIAAFESPYLGDDLADKKFYLYAKCNKAAQGEEGYQVAEYVLTQTAIAMNSLSGYYHLLVGVLNSEVDGDRSFVTLFGFTEVLPGRITTDKIVSSEGTTFFDLVQNILQLGDKFRYDPANGLILKGALVQTGSGENVVIGAWCGQYDANRTYQLGDEVWWQAADGTVSTYRYINATPSSGHLPTDDNYWQFVAKGVKGDAVLFADLSNEADGVAVGSDGILDTAVSLETTVSLYMGHTAETLTAITPAVPAAFSSKIHLSPTLATGVIAITIDANTNFNSVSQVDIPITVTSANGSRTVTFTIIPVKEGEDGAVYKLVPSVDVVKGAYVNGTLTYAPTSVTCQRMARTGSGTLASSTLGTLKYSVDGGSSINNYSSAIQVSAAVSAGRIIFYWYIGSVLIDRETVPIVSDGQQGGDGNDGDDGNGIASITEDYARSLNGNTPPSSWSSTKPSQIAGYFIWTRRTVKFTDTSMADFVTYQAVYCAVDGSDGDDGNDGARGPSSPYAGEYDANTYYYGNDTRCDVVYYNGQYYQALPNAPQSPFVGKIPTNTVYWTPFGTSFSNVATGLLFAVRAVIENAVVRLLETAESGKRIVIGDNIMQMYDSSDVVRLLISGNNISDAGTSQNVTLTDSLLLDRDIAFPSDQINHGSGYTAEEESDTATLTLTADGGTVKIPSRTISYSLQVSLSSGSITMIIENYLVVDGVSQLLNSYGTGASTSSTGGSGNITTPAKTLTLSKGSHTVKYKSKVTVKGTDAVATSKLKFSVQTTAAVNATISYSTRLVEIGANGFRVMLSSNQMAQFAVVNNSASFVIRSADYGIWIEDGVMKMMVGQANTWKTVTAATDSTIGTYLKLT